MMDKVIQTEAIISTVVYSLLGVSIMAGAILFFNFVFKLDLRRELVEDQNIAFGVLFGGLAVAIAIIIAASII